MAELFIHHHLGLGDMIHMNGLVRNLLRQGWENVYVFSKNCYKDMTEWMYRDEPKIKIVGIDETKNEYEEVLAHMKKTNADPYKEFIRIGHEFYKDEINEIGPLSCDMIFYSQMGVPYYQRFDSCYWKRDLSEEERVYNKLTPKDGKYIFVHDDPARGFELSDKKIKIELPIIRNDMSESIFNLGKLLENAKEIHVMESSIRPMIEFFKPALIKNKVKLYFHGYMRNLGPHYNKEQDQWNGTHLPWELVKKEDEV